MNDEIRYLISFLLVLVYRAGGTLVIENLSEIAGKQLRLSMDLDREGDKVTLTVEDLKPTQANGK